MRRKEKKGDNKVKLELYSDGIKQDLDDRDARPGYFGMAATPSVAVALGDSTHAHFIASNLARTCALKLISGDAHGFGTGAAAASPSEVVAHKRDEPLLHFIFTEV